MFRSAKWITGLLVVLLLLVLPTTVYAVSVLINTNNSSVDTVEWAKTSATITDPETEALNWDIVNGWVGSDASNLYFRARVHGFIPENAWNSIEAVLDCDRDGNYQENVDMVVYLPSMTSNSEQLGQCQGDDYPLTSGQIPCMAKIDMLDATWGEAIQAGGYTDYEWKANYKSGTNVSWAACTGWIKVMFRSADFTNGDLSFKQIQDETGWIDFNVPTAIELAQLNARQAAAQTAALQWALFAFIAGLAGCIGLWWVKRKLA